MVQEKKLIEAYIKERKGVDVNIDIIQVASEPRQISMFFHAYRVALDWFNNKKTNKQ